MHFLMVDPPWPKKKGGLRKVKPKQTRELDYTTMSIEEIFTLLDKEIFPDNNHVVWLWTVDEFLRPAEEEMEKRNYRRHARMVWDKKRGIAPAFSIRYQHEYLLWYYKPKMIPVATAMRGKLGTVFTEASREHSRKPEIAYAMAEQLFPGIPKYDIFSRTERSGWTTWGDQKGYFNA